MTPTVVLSPGGPGLGTETLAELPLPRGWRRLAADSACGEGDDPSARQTARLIDLLDEAGRVAPVVLVGHSAGVWSVIRAAATSPVRPAGIVLIGAQVRDRIDDPDLLNERLGALNGPLGDVARRACQALPAEAPADDATLRRLLIADMALSLSAIGPAERRYLASCARTWDLNAARAFLLAQASGQAPGPDLPETAALVTAPVMVINGAHDPWSGELSARELAAAVPNCTVEIVPGAGHAPWLDDTEEVRRLLTRFIERIRDGRNVHAF